MLKLVTFCFVAILGSTNGHNGNNQEVQNLRDADANLQADLMPQELQSEYGGEPDPVQHGFRKKLMEPDGFMGLPFQPLVSPSPRLRRSAAVEIGAPESGDSSVTSIAEQVKQYSRVIACFVLVVSAAIEVVVYIIEAYQIEGP